MQIFSIGEVLWDVFAHQEHLGGAPLNFSASAARLGNSVALLSAVGIDQRGAAALEGMRALQLTTEFVQLSKRFATGAAIIVTDSDGNASYVFDRPAAFDDLTVDEALLDRLEEVDPDWIYFGTLSQCHVETEQALDRIVGRLSRARCFYDLNLRDGHWNLPLVQRLSSMATVMKLNDTEAETLSKLAFGQEDIELEAFCKRWSATYSIEVICITLGSKGCAVFAGDRLETYSGFEVRVADTVGAGDAFSAAFLHGLHLGWPMIRTARFANAVGATVASHAGATPDWTMEECLRMID